MMDAKDDILRLCDNAIEHSYHSNGWERIMIVQAHLNKAIFCLTGGRSLLPPSRKPYTPSLEDLHLAELHLQAMPMDVVSNHRMFNMAYHLIRSELYKCNGELSIAKQDTMKAKELCCSDHDETENSFFSPIIPLINARMAALKQMELDPIDKALEEYETLKLNQ